MTLEQYIKCLEESAKQQAYEDEDAYWAEQDEVEAQKQAVLGRLDTTNDNEELPF